MATTQNDKKLVELSINPFRNDGEYELKADFDDDSHYIVIINENDRAITVCQKMMIFGQKIIRKPEGA